MAAFRCVVFLRVSLSERQCILHNAAFSQMGDIVPLLFSFMFSEHASMQTDKVRHQSVVHGTVLNWLPWPSEHLGPAVR